MSIYLTRSINNSFDIILSKLKEALHAEDYLIATEINVQGALKNKLNVDLPQIQIIGTNTPKVGYQIFTSDPKLGVLLPFSIVLHELNDNHVEVTMIDPVWLFSSVDNIAITTLAAKIKLTFKGILENL